MRDRQLGTTSLVSKNSAGEDGGGGPCASPAISADGRYVAFESDSIHLVDDDSNAKTDIFVHDLLTGATSRVSLMNVSPPPPNVNQATDHCVNPSISGDGRFVVFHSVASTLVAGDTNNTTDVFLRDRLAGTTVRMSLATGGAQGDEGSQLAAISGDGKLVAFESPATNLVPGDTNDRSDVFLRDPQGCVAGGAWTGYGAGLAGKGGAVPGLFGAGCPLPGATVTLQLDGIVGGAPGVLFVGLASASVPFKGGSFHVAALFLGLNIAVGGAPGIAGAGSLALPAPLPPDAALTGLSLFLQAGFSDAAAVQQVSLTQGLQLTIG